MRTLDSTGNSSGPCVEREGFYLLQLGMSRRLGWVRNHRRLVHEVIHVGEVLGVRVAIGAGVTTRPIHAEWAE